ncbi:MAG: SAP domain-containing protein [Christensenellaceae bacterium]|jgi:hypothetical protein
MGKQFSKKWTVHEFSKESYTVEELKEISRSVGLPVSGNKEELTDNIKEYLTKERVKEGVGIAKKEAKVAGGKISDAAKELGGMIKEGVQELKGHIEKELDDKKKEE